MTISEFIGCALLAFGPPLAMFVITIAYDPVRVIILVAAAFCWLLSFLVSSIIWFAVVPLRDFLVFGLMFSILFQELFRYGMYLLIRRTESSLKQIADNDHFSNCKLTLAYVCGLGFGLMSGSFAMTNVLADSLGPGTLGLKSGNEFFFVTSAATTLCMILLNTFWSVIFFNGMDEKNYLKVVWVIGTHYLVSSLTLLNRYQMYASTLLPAYVVLFSTLAIAFKCIGGSYNSLKLSFTNANNNRIVENPL